MQSRKNLVFALAITTAASASIMMISVAYRAGYAAGSSSETVSVTGAAESLPTVEEARTMLAKVTNITGTTITANSLLVGSKAQLATTEVVTTGTTSFVRSIPKDQKTLQAELDAFREKMKQPSTATSTPLLPPLPFVIENISLADIHTSDVIFVTSADKILPGQPITATKILVESAPAEKR